MPSRLLICGLLLLVTACNGRRASDQRLPETAFWGPALLLTARHSHSASYDVARRRLMVFGGVGADDAILLEDDPRNAYRPAEFDGPAARHGHAMVYDPLRGEHLLFGGVDRNGALRGDTWRWNGSDWRELAFLEAPTARAYHAMAYDPVSRRVLLFGGVDAQGFVGDTWAFDGAAWLRIGSSATPGARAGHALASDGPRGVLLFGGSSNAQLHDDTWRFDGAAWQRLSITGPAARVGHTLGALRDGVVLFGGRGQVDFDDTWVLRNDTWQRLDIAGPSARWLHACSSDGSGVVVVGGALSRRPSSEIWRFAGDTWSQVAPEQHPEARYDAAMTQTGGAALLFGGLRDTTAIAPPPLLEDTWLHTARGWQRVAAASSPPARSGAALAALEVSALPGARVGAVLFGGLGSSGLLGDTWTFVDDSWTLRALPGPAPRQHAACAYHPRSQAAVLFGGRDANGVRGDTWLFDGAAWRELAIGGPPRRDLATLAYDTVSGALLLFGGAAEDGSELGDTWTFDGRAWRQVFAAQAPSPRRHAAMTTLREGRGVALFGGTSMSPFSDLEWRWDGAAWRRVDLLRSPGARAGAGLALVPGSGLLLFGGLLDGATRHDSWFHSEPAIALAR